MKTKVKISDLHAYRDFYISTYSGKRIQFVDMKPDDIDIEDIAHALSLNCRYNGHCDRFYSVAEHSLLVSDLLPDKLKVYGLLHDAGEAYITDIPRPLKKMLDEYTDGLIYLMESTIMHNVYAHFNLPRLSKSDESMVQIADNTALAMEAELMFSKDAIKDWKIGEVLENRPEDVGVYPFERSPVVIKEIFNEQLKNHLVNG